MIRVVFLLCGLVASGLTEYSEQTDRFHDSLGQCATNTEEDRQCIGNVKAGLEKASEYIDKVGELRQKLQSLSNGLNTLRTITKFVKYIPTVGQGVTALKITADTMKPILSRSLNAVKSIDRKLQPWKPRVERGIETTMKAELFVALVTTTCNRGRNAINAAQNCVDSLEDGNLKDFLGGKLEQTSNALLPGFDVINSATGQISRKCDAAEDFANKIRHWPSVRQLDGILRQVNRIHRPLRNILGFFRKIETGLNKEFCIDIGKLGRAIGNVAYEVGHGIKKVTKTVRHSVRKAGRSIVREFLRLFGRRRRSANDSELRVKRSRFCLSTRKVLDGVDKSVGFLLNEVNKFIGNLLKNIPALRIPGLPDFVPLKRLSLNIDLPDTDFSFDRQLMSKLRNLKWDCSTQVENVCRARSLSVSYDCSIWL